MHLSALPDCSTIQDKSIPAMQCSTCSRKQPLFSTQQCLSLPLNQ